MNKVRMGLTAAACSLALGVGGAGIASAQTLNTAAPVQGVASQVGGSSLPLRGVVEITNVTGGLADGVFTGTIGGVPVALPFNDVPLTQVGSGVCRVLNLNLGPLHLDLLGLNVDLSKVTLRITAQRGAGILGDLLCGLAGG